MVGGYAYIVVFVYVPSGLVNLINLRKFNRIFKRKVGDYAEVSAVSGIKCKIAYG